MPPGFIYRHQRAKSTMLGLGAGALLPEPPAQACSELVSVNGIVCVRVQYAEVQGGGV